jgi:TPR repeat protein
VRGRSRANRSPGGIGEAGATAAQVELRQRYALGEGVDQDLDRANQWYRAAADTGDAEAQYRLGRILVGRGGADDLREAAQWYERAAGQGRMDAKRRLGILHYDGRGVPQDYRKAFELYMSAADQGDAAAQFNLGVMVENGIAVQSNLPLAASWYLNAAQQGVAAAENNLGRLYQGTRSASRSWGGYPMVSHGRGAWLCAGAGHPRESLLSRPRRAKGPRRGDAVAGSRGGNLRLAPHCATRSSCRAFSWLACNCDCGVLASLLTWVPLRRKEER